MTDDNRLDVRYKSDIDKIIVHHIDIILEYLDYLCVWNAEEGQLYADNEAEQVEVLKAWDRIKAYTKGKPDGLAYQMSPMYPEIREIDDDIDRVYTVLSSRGVAQTHRLEFELYLMAHLSIKIGKPSPRDEDGIIYIRQSFDDRRSGYDDWSGLGFAEAVKRGILRDKIRKLRRLGKNIQEIFIETASDREEIEKLEDPFGNVAQ